MSRPISFCIVRNCSIRRFGHGYCQLHYDRWRKHGSSLLGFSTQEKHGKYGTPEYVAWNAMKRRCLWLSPRDKNYKLYHGKGIKICDRWLNSFANFYEDMGDKPSLKHSLDRIDSDGGYEPSNCRWATPIEQASNTSRNRRITIKGETRTFAGWVRRYNRKLSTVRGRYYGLGWSIERALDI